VIARSYLLPAALRPAAADPPPAAAAAAAAMSSGGVLFGRDAWDPVTIVAQIVAVQCLYYLSLGLLFKLIVGEPAGSGSKQAGRSLVCWARLNRHCPLALQRISGSHLCAAALTYLLMVMQPLNTLFTAVHPSYTRPLLPPTIAAPYVPALSLYHFFDWRWVSFSSFRGWMVSVATFTNALLAAVYLRLIVRQRRRGGLCAGSVVG